MAQGERKAKIVWLLRILFEETDQERGLTMPQIIERLEAHGIGSERKGLYKDIEVLRECGFGIEVLSTRPPQYALSSRPFEEEQLGLVIDAVQSSHVLTEKKTKELLEAILSLASRDQRGRLQELSSVGSIAKMENERIYYNIDAIRKALSRKCKITFKYFQYDLDKQRQVEKNNDGTDKIYTQNPVHLAYVNDRYYLIAYNDKYEDFNNYRVDRMQEIEVREDEPRTRNSQIANFEIAPYLAKTFGMFSGDVEVSACFRVNEKGMRSFIDRFGSGLESVRDADHEGWAKVFVRVSESAPLYSWLCGMGENVFVESPKSLVEGYKAHLGKIMSLY